MQIEAVEMRRVSKRLGATPALIDVSATFSRGVSVIVGPNGSGKSTLLKLLALVGRPSRGDILINGHIGWAHAEALRRVLGYLAHEPQLYPELSGYENLSFSAKLHNLEAAQERIKNLCTQLQIGTWVNRAASTYSRGQLQRVGLARSLLHNPQLWLLDEPTTGLDANSVSRVVETIVAAAEQTVVVVVTHDAELVQSLRSRVYRMDKGRLALDG